MRHAEHKDLAMVVTGDNTMKRLALLCTGEKNKHGRDHQHQRTDDQQQYLGSAPPLGGLRRRLIRLIVSHARSTIETTAIMNWLGVTGKANNKTTRYTLSQSGRG